MDMDTVLGFVLWSFVFVSCFGFRISYFPVLRSKQHVMAEVTNKPAILLWFLHPHSSALTRLSIILAACFALNSSSRNRLRISGITFVP
jgi:hypothetical protein